ncbi:unnamed protein product [Ectocarpus sp. 13 AM-2016]
MRGQARLSALLSRVRPPFVPPSTKAGRWVHTEAADGFGGNNASLYENTRPGYPARALRAIEAEIRRSGLTGSGELLVDLGAGTGKFTREILPFALSEGLSLVAVEPVKAMRDQFEAAVPGVRVVGGVGEAIPFPDSSVRALVAAQSFHWMSSAATLREVHRVLVPGGLFVLMWNTRDCTRPWVRALEDIIDPFYGNDVPRQQGGQWRQSFRDLEQSRDDTRPDNGQKHRSFFGELAEQHFKHSKLLTLEELEGGMRSISVIATRPERERADAFLRAQRVVETHPDTREGLRLSGRVELFYDTEVYWCNKTSLCK